MPKTGAAMTLQYILLTMLFAQNWHIIVANGNVSVVPQNTTAIINQSVYFTCSFLSTSEDVHWSLDSETNFIYAGGEIIGPFKQRFSVNISSGVSTLIISPVESKDAGKYICQDGGFREGQFTAFLIVLEDHPSCKSNQGTDGFIGPNICGITPDLVELSCTIKFYGEIPPEMTWKNAGENRAVDGITTIVTTNKSVTYTLRMETNLALENSSYSCQTTQLTGNQLHCQSGFINVINIQNNKHTINKSVGDEVTCSGHADQICGYSWQLLQSSGNVSVLSSSVGTRIKLALKLENPGIYICEEVCVIHGVPCAIPRMVVNVPETEENKGLRFLAMILISLVPTILIIVYFKRRRQRENTATVVFKTSRTTDDAEPKPAGGSNTNGQQGNTDEARIECETSPAVYEPLLKNSANEWHEATGGNTDQQEAENVVIRNPSELIKTIITKAAEKENTPIYGMDILGDELFIATGWSSKIEVWKLDELTYSRLFEVEGLLRPFDLVSCTRNVCLYIFDFKGEDVKSKEIIRVDTNGLIIKRWFIENDVCQSLSVTDDKNVIFATFEEDVPHVLEYSPDGELLHSIKVEPDTQLNRILHVIKVADDQFLVSHGSIKYKNVLHRVCVVKADRPDVDKHVLSCVERGFGDVSGSSENQLCVPMHLAVKRDGKVLVADRENSRVLLLSWPGLSFIREQIPKTSSAYMLRKAYRLCLNDSNDLLFVIDNAELPKKTRWGDGRILVFKV